MKNGKFEFYVTFASDRSAALAFTFNVSENSLLYKESEQKKWFVEPANTWLQPLEQSVAHGSQNAASFDVDHRSLNDEMKPPLLQLNDDCLNHLFKFCDLEALINLSQVCKTFNKLLRENKCFRQFHTLQICVNDLSEDKYTTLGIARKKLIRTGKHIKKLAFEFDDSAINMNLQRYLEKIGQYVGENVRELAINDVCLAKEHLHVLKTILKRLTVLKIK